jgi:5-dehydro-4-deoxyglucarate dehydratase
MSKMTPTEMVKRLTSGLLSFPVTHFDRDGAFAEKEYRAHCSWLLRHSISGLFAAGGTGEFFSLTPPEVEEVVRAAVIETNGRVPVIAGAGYGTAIAIEMVKAAEKAGADGILLFPPYLLRSTQDGLAAHVDAVCKATGLGIVVYNRDNAILNEDTLEWLCDRNANLVGFKDGVGDIELIMRVYARMGSRLSYIGGLPTAETYSLPYLEIGVTTYSSAIFNFMPEWAMQFYNSVRARDHATVMAMLADFVMPYITLRNANPGYAVSIVKAGMRAINRPAGLVRPPLTDLTEAEFSRLKLLIERANATVMARSERAISAVD